MALGVALLGRGRKVGAGEGLGLLYFLSNLYFKLGGMLKLVVVSGRVLVLGLDILN